jgi:hypothetical protein
MAVIVRAYDMSTLPGAAATDAVVVTPDAFWFFLPVAPIPF